LALLEAVEARAMRFQRGHNSSEVEASIWTIVKDELEKLDPIKLFFISRELLKLALDLEGKSIVAEPHTQGLDSTFGSLVMTIYPRYHHERCDDWWLTKGGHSPSSPYDSVFWYSISNNLKMLKSICNRKTFSSLQNRPQLF
jgi:hypothetical protein